MTSTHKVEIIPIVLEKHPNADTLSVIRAFGYTICGKTADWTGVEKAAYLPPDSLSPISRPEFSWLSNTTKTFYTHEGIKISPGSPEPAYARVTIKRFRGTLSYGLLVPAPEGSKPGDDVAEILGVKHYNPPEPLTTGGEACGGPKGINTLKYDLDSYQRYAQKAFVPGEEVILTEKIHGASGRWVFTGGEFHCGSRTEWKREFPTGGGPQNLWWRALKAYPEMMNWLEKNPDYVVYGEVFGQVQNLKYGTKVGEVRIGVFDIMKNGEWLDPDQARQIGQGLPWVPIVTRMPFDFESVLNLAEGSSLVPGADHFREGVVVSPLKERYDDEAGRVKLKAISPSYLEKC